MTRDVLTEARQENF